MQHSHSRHQKTTLKTKVKKCNLYVLYHSITQEGFMEMWHGICWHVYSLMNRSSQRRRNDFESGWASPGKSRRSVVISKTKTKESNAKSGLDRPTQLKKWVGHWPTWPTRFRRHWVIPLTKETVKMYAFSRLYKCFQYFGHYLDMYDNNHIWM